MRVQRIAWEPPTFDVRFRPIYRVKAMVKMDLGYFFEAMGLVLVGDFVGARGLLFHSDWTSR